MTNDCAKLISFLTRINKENFSSPEVSNFCNEKIDEIYAELGSDFNQSIQLVAQDFTEILLVTTTTPEWKYICLNFYCLHLLNIEMKKQELLSVSQTKDLKDCFKSFIHAGILQNINPNLPFYKSLRSHKIEVEDQYFMLKATVCGLFKYAMIPTLRYYVLPCVIQSLLVALFQLTHCPLKKPSSSIEGSFKMSETFYQEVLKDQNQFSLFIEKLQNSVNPSLYLKELMVLFKSNSPNWFKKAISLNLTKSIKQQNGLENLLTTMLAGEYDDNTTMWRVIDIITKIIISIINTPDFQTYISPQIKDLLKTAIMCNGRESLAFEKFYAVFTKTIHPLNQQESNKLLDVLFSPLKKISKKVNRTLSNEEITFLAKEIEQTIRIIHFIFLDTKEFSLPTDTLSPFISILFNIYVVVHDSELKSLKEDLYDIILQHIETSSQLHVLFENFFFNIEVKNILNIHEYIEICASSDGLKIKFSNEKVNRDIVKNAHAIYMLCKSKTNLFFSYFNFLLNCLGQINKYISDTSLLESEEEGNLSNFEKKIALYEMLSILANDGVANKCFTEKLPVEILDYFNNVFINAIKTKSYSHSDNFHLIFTISMILENIVKNKKYQLELKEILNSVKIIHNETTNPELKSILFNILNASGNCKNSIEKNEIEEIVHETFDESIPIKGHGLIALERLVSSRNKEAVKRKQYIFTIFKQNLTHRDTYVYQAAIKGLASMADLGTECTDMVLETLCEEYTDFPREEFGPDASEMRMKISEVLIQISKKLGDMAPKYKAILLNTFLNGTKDDDHLIRASSLANLGEICQVLGFKLGSIVTEILVCVHTVISTDKYPEPKRAATLVIRQLLSGLGSDMLTVLKDDILVIYRTLKFLYSNDQDDVLRLHSQLALEELNKNMEQLMLPQIETKTEKKIVVLK